MRIIRSHIESDVTWAHFWCRVAAAALIKEYTEMCIGMQKQASDMLANFTGEDGFSLNSSNYERELIHYESC
jgi:hypothetical protein